jgi:hypothetical protein
MALLGVTLSRTATNMPARKHAAKLAKNLGFSSEKLDLPENKYIAWLDLMGAGHLMGRVVHSGCWITEIQPPIIVGESQVID